MFWLYFLCWYIWDVFWQVSWCSAVFDEPVQAVCNMVSAALQSLDKNIASAFSQYLETQDNVLSSITELKQVSYIWVFCVWYYLDNTVAFIKYL